MCGAILAKKCEVNVNFLIFLNFWETNLALFERQNLRFFDKSIFWQVKLNFWAINLCFLREKACFKVLLCPQFLAFFYVCKNETLFFALNSAFEPVLQKCYKFC